MATPDPNEVVIFEDTFGFAKPGGVFYPASLRQVAGALRELVGEEIRHPRSFNANIELYLDLILGRFRSFHDTHRKALAVHAAYRTEGRQYCVYLRSFALGGVVLSTDFQGERIVQSQGWSAQDRSVRELVKEALPDDFAGISFVNTFDVYPSGNEQGDAVQYIERATFPSLRVLSHNWRGIVREVVRGARMIVLVSYGEGAGLDYEIQLVRSCGMADRTVVAGQELERKISDPAPPFADLVDLGSIVDSSGEAAERLRDAIRALATDTFDQTQEVDDLSHLRCWVVDRGIDADEAIFSDERFRHLPYDHFIPSSLSGNWNLLQASFEGMLNLWGGLETRWKQGEPPGVEELGDAMYAALGTFYLAATLERYREMALALSTVGMAHRAITGEIRIMASCFRHALDCATWLEDPELIRHFQEADRGLKEEMAQRDG